MVRPALSPISGKGQTHPSDGFWLNMTSPPAGETFRGVTLLGKQESQAVAANGKRRFPELDGLRGIAALWVVLFHYTFGVANHWLKHDLSLAAQVTPWNASIDGLRAVDLFFIVSGFVIFMTLDSSKSLLDFVVSRFARLFPAYWFSVLLTSTVVILIPVVGQSATGELPKSQRPREAACSPFCRSE